MEQTDINSLLLVLSISFFIIIVFVISFVMLYQKRKNSLLMKQRLSEQQFAKELADTRIEIRDDIMKKISWELHDNLGQLLTLAKIQLQSTEDSSEALPTIDTALSQLRMLSKSIHRLADSDSTLLEVVTEETARLNRLKFINAKIESCGEEFYGCLAKEQEVFIFRILQEFFSNTLKHSEANLIRVSFDFSDENKFTITASDNGIGFNPIQLQGSGIGLETMKKRAHMAGLEYTLNSQPNTGTQLSLTAVCG